jgi:hypothetical protein
MSFIALVGGLNSCRQFSFERSVRKWFLFNTFLFSRCVVPADNETPWNDRKLLTRLAFAAGNGGYRAAPSQGCRVIPTAAAQQRSSVSSRDKRSRRLVRNRRAIRLREIGRSSGSPSRSGVVASGEGLVNL